MASDLETIGILGGAGPRATATLFFRLISTLQDRYMMAEDADFPSVVVDSTVMEEMSVYGFTEPFRQSILTSLAARCDWLEAGGAQIILPGCNTFASFHEDLLVGRKATLIDLPLSALEEAKKKGYSKVTVLASQTTRRLGIFEERARKVGIEVIPITDREQASVTIAIGSAMSGLLRSGEEMRVFINSLPKRGSEAVILGCTDLSLLPVLRHATTPIIDTLETGIDRAIELSLGVKNESL
jgi:aspartate racemase